LDVTYVEDVEAPNGAFTRRAIGVNGVCFRAMMQVSEFW
jgi:hypothetical protein